MKDHYNSFIMFSIDLLRENLEGKEQQMSRKYCHYCGAELQGEEE